MHRLVFLLFLSTCLCVSTFLWTALAEAQEAPQPASGEVTDEADSSQPAGSEARRERRASEISVARVHDPSTIVRQDGRYWLFYTARDIGSLYSDDLKSWRRGPAIFERPPDWVDDVVPEHRGSFWAPDVIQLGDRYLVYYSVSAFGKQTSAIALASSPTLDPSDPRYAWTDHGVVVKTDPSSDHNAIDPSVCLTSEGELWMAYGSFWSGLKLVQLDPETGLRVSENSPIYPLASHEQIEAPGLYEHDGYFYLFVNWGWCCRGINSTYNIRVGRSRSITGPYLDREGNDLRHGGGTLVLATEGEEIGPGHAGLLQVAGEWMLSYHYYDAEARGRPRLGLRRLHWTEDGWPVVGAKRPQK